MSKRDFKLFLYDILEAIERIENYTKNMSYRDFLRDRKTQDAVIRNLEIIGEAAKNLPKNIKKRYPKIPWRALSEMRDKLIHAYFGVSLSIVWETIKNDLPVLKQQVESILKDLKDESM
ncbi:MAG: hypothetical protein DRN04_02690 [Thermoprotei archaeon]|nr:MAG: hypothetical protein DRN04_02690 [Thermoprotei archaeon]